MEKEDLEEIKLGFVVSEFHRDITYQMEILGREHAAFLGAKVTRTVYTPGTFDMPLAVKKMVSENDKEKEVDAVVTLGCIIEGTTEHDEMIASQLTRKIMDLSLTGDDEIRSAGANRLCEKSGRSRGEDGKEA
jgi:6,7-dimethyl-8-ribityllumazine synthase